ncbi:MAG: pyridoxine 5'-phosphate synthase [Flavobacteriales bacterium]|nr:pyridoxine 5'-phosphate synthase [Flavobacteriales bacterium]
MAAKTKLSVNINKIATIRNARGGQIPNLTKFAQDCESFGADGITVHPRPDERHITRQDVFDLSGVVTTEFNIEGYPNERFLEIIREIKPAQATLVPDPPDTLTSNAGWNTIEHADFLKEVLAEIKSLGVRTSLFIETDAKMIEKAAEVGADRIEFYTGPYADEYAQSKEAAIAPYVETAKVALACNLGINAGHDLSLENLGYFNECIPEVDEVSIGHALISDALYYGIENTVQMYQRLLK